MSEEPEQKGKNGAEDEAGDDREIKCGVFAAVHDISGKPSEAKGEFAAEIEKSADEDKETAKKEQSAAEITKRIHKESLEE